MRWSDEVTSPSSGLECVTGALRPGADRTLSLSDFNFVGPVGPCGTLPRLTLTLLALWARMGRCPHLILILLALLARLGCCPPSDPDPVGPYGTLSPSDPVNPVGPCGTLSLSDSDSVGTIGPYGTLSPSDPVDPVGPCGMLFPSVSDSVSLVGPYGTLSRLILLALLACVGRCPHLTLTLLARKGRCS